MEKQLLYLLDYDLRISENDLLEAFTPFMPATHISTSVSKSSKTTEVSPTTPPEDPSSSIGSLCLASGCSPLGQGAGAVAMSMHSSVSSYSDLENAGLTDDHGSCSSSSGSEFEELLAISGAEVLAGDNPIIKPVPTFGFRRKFSNESSSSPIAGESPRLTLVTRAPERFVTKPEESVRNFHRKCRGSGLHLQENRSDATHSVDESSSLGSRFKQSSSSGFLSRMWNISLGKAAPSI